MANVKFLNNWQSKKIQASKNHQTEAYKTVNELIFKKRKGKKVTLLDGTKVVEFVSCSYLGLDTDSRLTKSSLKNLKKYGTAFHSARTRFQPKSAIKLDSLLSKIYCDSFPVTFPTLHMAHQGFIPLLASGQLPNFPIKSEGPLFILDKTVHASIQINRGIMEQFSEVVLIDFQQIESVKKIFRKAFRTNKTPIAIADSIGSMSNITPIKELLNISHFYNGYVYLDDAHGTSVHGRHGCGYVLKQLNYQFPSHLILAVSLGKGFGVVGGALLLPKKEDSDFVKRFASTYIFSGPLPSSVIDAAISSAKIHLTDEIYQLQKKLWENVNYFDTLMHGRITNMNIASPLRGIFIGDEFKAIRVAKELRQKGIAVTVAMYPTVPKNKSILRVAFSASHSRQDIKKLCAHTQKIIKKTLIPTEGIITNVSSQIAHNTAIETINSTASNDN